MTEPEIRARLAVESELLTESQARVLVLMGFLKDRDDAHCANFVQATIGSAAMSLLALARNEKPVFEGADACERIAREK